MPKYVVTNGRSYLRQLNRKGKYGLSPRTDATVWGTYKQALNALNNAISKDVKTLFYVEKANASAEIDVNKLIEADMSDFNRWISDIGNFPKFVGALNSEKKKLILEMQVINQELCDIRHYIEFSKLNAYQGWAAYKMMKVSLIRRRKILDAMYIIHRIQTRSANTTETESAKAAIHSLNQRIYTPRRLDILFEDNYCTHYSTV